MITDEQARNLARIFYAANQRHAREMAEQQSGHDAAGATSEHKEAGAA